MGKGSVGLRDSKKIPSQLLEEDTSDQASSDDIQKLKKQVRRLQFELDVMKEIVHVIKKGLGVNPNPLFQENHCANGYHRIWAVLRKRGCLVSEKVVRRHMVDADLQTAYRENCI